MIEVVLRAVRVDLASSSPVLLLEERNGSRALPIFIGGPEAAAIAYALDNIPTTRPMTHDLLGNTVEALGAQLHHVAITDLVDSSYIATIHLVRDGHDVALDARPSDAVALAIRHGAPITVRDDLMADHGVEIDPEDGDDDEDQLVDEMRRFLDNIRPEDFS
jgi:bifunctional DNase/RNase